MLLVSSIMVVKLLEADSHIAFNMVTCPLKYTPENYNVLLAVNYR